MGTAAIAQNDVSRSSLNETVNATQTVTLEQELEDLKQEVLELNRDLFVLEEDLLFPASTQMAVYLSVDVAELFRLDNVKLMLNGEPVTHHLYTERDLDALRRGGVQKLYLGNLPAGEHELVAVMLGYGPQQREYKRATKLLFEKSTGAKLVEIKISDNETKQQPEFTVREW